MLTCPDEDDAGVGVTSGTAVGVGVFAGVGVGVGVGALVGVGVAVLVGAEVGVGVGVLVGANVGVGVAVLVGSDAGVDSAASDDADAGVGVSVAVATGVGVAVPAAGSVGVIVISFSPSVAPPDSLKRILSLIPSCTALALISSSVIAGAFPIPEKCSISAVAAIPIPRPRRYDDNFMNLLSFQNHTFSNRSMTSLTSPMPSPRSLAIAILERPIRCISRMRSL